MSSCRLCYLPCRKSCHPQDSDLCSCMLVSVESRRAFSFFLCHFVPLFVEKTTHYLYITLYRKTILFVKEKMNKNPLITAFESIFRIFRKSQFYSLALTRKKKCVHRSQGTQWTVTTSPRCR